MNGRAARDREDLIDTGQHPNHLVGAESAVPT